MRLHTSPKAESTAPQTSTRALRAAAPHTTIASAATEKARTAMDSRGSLLDRPRPDVDALRPAPFGHDPDFAQVMRTLESQSELMREQLRSSEASERRSFVLSVLSLAVSLVSLAIALVSLLSQFGVI